MGFTGHGRYLRELEDACRDVIAHGDGKPLRDFVRRWKDRGAPLGSAQLQVSTLPDSLVVPIAWKHATFLPGLSGLAPEAKRWLNDHRHYDDGFAAGNLILRDWPKDDPTLGRWRPGEVQFGDAPS